MKIEIRERIRAAEQRTAERKFLRDQFLAEKKLALQANQVRFKSGKAQPFVRQVQGPGGLPSRTPVVKAPTQPDENKGENSLKHLAFPVVQSLQ